jgi:hypothetical protein
MTAAVVSRCFSLFKKDEIQHKVNYGEGAAAPCHHRF